MAQLRRCERGIRKGHGNRVAYGAACVNAATATCRDKHSCFECLPSRAHSRSAAIDAGILRANDCAASWQMRLRMRIPARSDGAQMHDRPRCGAPQTAHLEPNALGSRHDVRRRVTSMVYPFVPPPGRVLFCGELSSTHMWRTGGRVGAFPPKATALKTFADCPLRPREAVLRCFTEPDESHPPARQNIDGIRPTVDESATSVAKLVSNGWWPTFRRTHGRAANARDWSRVLSEFRGALCRATPWVSPG